ncbi:MAG: hypothetical protein JKY50_21310 [Oleispira sp.]|nr:hypothetical protein [Oleispira sp.]MBL4882094.1 hypothetical protein [Oleispira sp.]
MRIVSVVRSAIVILLLAMSTAHAESGDLNIYGFMSVGVAALDNNSVALDDFESDANFKQDTVLGIQISKQVNDSTTVTGQLVSRGIDDFKTEAAWAFISFEATESTTLRMGRLRVPFFYYSEFLEVGYAYNWVRLPNDIYGIPFSSFDGADLVQNFSLGSVDGYVQINYGRQNNDLTLFQDTYTADIKNLAGISLNLTQGDFGMRLGVQQTDMSLDSVTDPDLTDAYRELAIASATYDAMPNEVTGGILVDANNAVNKKSKDLRRIDQAQSAAAGLVAAGMPISASTLDDFNFESKQANFYNAAFTYDNGDFSFITETTLLMYETGLLVDNRAWLASMAQRFSAVTIHLTYSNSKDILASGEKGDLQEALKLEGEDQSVILGLRYDYDVNTAVKFEVQHHDELVNQGEDGDQAMLYSFAVDVIF